ncbi:MAG: hypothetical protein M1837_003844 [Sclerophora amabilis]|nr:MAG: hypothetical protein M1837_003844 [Sclerophora amabilis]
MPLGDNDTTGLLNHHGLKFTNAIVRSAVDAPSTPYVVGQEKPHGLSIAPAGACGMITRFHLGSFKIKCAAPPCPIEIAAYDSTYQMAEYSTTITSTGFEVVEVENLVGTPPYFLVQIFDTRGSTANLEFDDFVFDCIGTKTVPDFTASVSLCLPGQFCNRSCLIPMMSKFDDAMEGGDLTSYHGLSITGGTITKDSKAPSKPNALYQTVVEQPIVVSPDRCHSGFNFLGASAYCIDYKGEYCNVAVTCTYPDIGPLDNTFQAGKDGYMMGEAGSFPPFQASECQFAIESGSGGAVLALDDVKFSARVEQ